MNPDLQRFVREALARGLKRDAIRDALRKAGWRADEIEAALRAWTETDLPVPVPRRRPYLNAREAFFYLVLFATLYTTAFNTGQVLFAMIELWVPDALHAGPDGDSFGDWVRGATAGIVIAFPVYLWLSRVIGREVAREPEKLGSPIRKWLTYITLFIAALVIIGDLTVLVTRLLSGELAPRFLLKVLVVFLIAAIVFGHYLDDLRRDEQEGARAGIGPRPLARVAAGAVFAVMLAGLVFAGSPVQARRARIDDQRIEALRRIAGAVDQYAERRGVLPDSLEALLRVPDAFSAETLRDPESGETYAYRPTGPMTYELCAVFRTDRTGSRARSLGEFWKHPAGRACFRLEVTKPASRLRPARWPPAE